MDWLNYHHLRYFWVVAREGNLASASKRLHVSLPSISEQIRALEDAMGKKLFRREGRGKVLTEAGRMVLGYADQIFALGEELTNNVRGQTDGRALQVHVGVVDSFPKLLTNRILKPVFDMRQQVHVMCREGKLEDLLPQLAAHRLDVVLADEPSAGNMKAKTFNHLLGESTLTVCASPALARRFKRGFPRSLDDAPALLPAANTSLRRSLEKWFHSEGIFPRVLAEFDDLALMKALAADGRGFIALPTAALEEACSHYGFVPLGRAGESREHYYAITAARRIDHPAITELTQVAHDIFD